MTFFNHLQRNDSLGYIARPWVVRVRWTLFLIQDRQRWFWNIIKHIFNCLIKIKFMYFVCPPCPCSYLFPSHSGSLIISKWSSYALKLMYSNFETFSTILITDSETRVLLGYCIVTAQTGTAVFFNSVLPMDLFSECHIFPETFHRLQLKVYYCQRQITHL